MTESRSAAELEGFLASHEKVAKPKVLAVGSTVGRWRVESFLGSGGSAEVYRVTDAGGGQCEAALKILARDDPSARLRFKTEKEVLSANSTPFLERFADCGESCGRPYIVTELLEPIDLPDEEGEIAEYLLGVCRALSSLHRAGLVHRDVKPSNIMRRPGEGIVLIDLGLVKDVVHGAEPRKDVSIVDGRVVAVGTPAYAAPEQMIGGEITAAADIHALGRMADAAFSGDPPPQWLPIIRRATSSIPDQRYATVDDLAAAIRDRNRPRRNAAIRAAALLAAAVSALAWWYWENIGREARKWNSLCENTYTNIIRRTLEAECPVTNRTGDVVSTEPRRVYKKTSVAIPATVVRLAGATNAFLRPLTLEPSRHYFIEGPGLLTADLRSASNTVVHLSNCWLFNKSTIPVEEANIKYVFGKKAYLNFTELDEPSQWLWHAVVENYDAGLNLIRFKGPKTLREFKDEHDRLSSSPRSMLMRGP